MTAAALLSFALVAATATVTIALLSKQGASRCRFISTEILRRTAACILPSRTVFALGRRTDAFIPWNLRRRLRLRWWRSPATAVHSLRFSDHSYSNEKKFADGVESAFDLTRSTRVRVILLSATPTRPEVEYGWTEPGQPLRFASATPHREPVGNLTIVVIS